MCHSINAIDEVCKLNKSDSLDPPHPGEPTLAPVFASGVVKVLLLDVFGLFLIVAGVAEVGGQPLGVEQVVDLDGDRLGPRAMLEMLQADMECARDLAAEQARQ